MSAPSMSILYGETKTVTFQPKTALGDFKAPASYTISGSAIGVMTIVPDPVVPYAYQITNGIFAGGTVGLTFNAVNSVADGGGTVSDNMTINAAAATPITQVSHVIS
jgi:hypothetical protein